MGENRKWVKALAEQLIWGHGLEKREANLGNKEVLWISCYAPYDKVGHAGGKIHNYYLKYLHKNCNNVRLLTICREEEIEKLDLDQYGIPGDIIVMKSRLDCKIVRFLGMLNAEYNIFHKYAGKLTGYRERPMKARLRKISQSGYRPKVIILQWTEVIMLQPYIRQLFPGSRMILIEEDVSYLSYYRQWKNASNRIKAFIYKKRYERLKEMELSFLNSADVVILNNHKDKGLIEKDGVPADKTFVWCPYFDNMSDVVRKPEYHDIIYYGAMNRKENYLSVIWFIKNVMPLIEDLDISLQIIGGQPGPALKKYESERVHVLGFVKDISPYFQKGLCLAAPLVLGAGVKIKILEAMSSGIPVLTNAIGIEGIFAEAGRDFFYCESPEEYADSIRKLVRREVDSNMISGNSKEFIRREYDFTKTAEEFIQTVKGFLEEKQANG